MCVCRHNKSFSCGISNIQGSSQRAPIDKTAVSIITDYKTTGISRFENNKFAAQPSPARPLYEGKKRNHVLRAIKLCSMAQVKTISMSRSESKVRYVNARRCMGMEGYKEPVVCGSSLVKHGNNGITNFWSVARRCIAVYALLL